MIITLFKSLPARFEASFLQVTQWTFQGQKFPFYIKTVRIIRSRCIEAGRPPYRKSVGCAGYRKQHIHYFTFYSEPTALLGRQGNGALRRSWLCFQGGLCNVCNVCKTHRPADWRGYF